MDFENVKQKFGSWADKFRYFIETPDFDNIFKHLIAARSRGKNICPASTQTFRAFSLTPYQQLKAVFVFSGPYASRHKDILMDDGIGLSCSNTGRLSIPLEKFYRGMEEDLSTGLNLDMIDDTDLSYLCEQGVLLINYALTAELDKPGSHHQLWRPFMEYFFTEVVNTYEHPLPVVFFGKQPASYNRLVKPFTHWVFETADLLSLHQEEKWSPEGLFRDVTKVIRQNRPGDPELLWFKEVNHPVIPRPQ